MIDQWQLRVFTSKLDNYYRSDFYILYSDVWMSVLKRDEEREWGARQGGRKARDNFPKYKRILKREREVFI